MKIGALATPTGPHSFVAIQPRSLMLAPATARALCATEMCLLCARTGDDDALVFCSDCGEAMHSYCIWPERDAAFIARAKLLYRCSNCTSCVGCGIRERDDLLVSCDACDSCFHTCCIQVRDLDYRYISCESCSPFDLLPLTSSQNPHPSPRIQPPMSAVPDGAWFCGACVSCAVCGQPQPPRRWSADAQCCRRCALTYAELCTVCAYPLVPGESVSMCEVCTGKTHERCDKGFNSPLAVRACMECSVACGEINAIARDVQVRWEPRLLPLLHFVRIHLTL